MTTENTNTEENPDNKPTELEIDIPGSKNRVKLPYEEAKKIIELRDKYENMLKDSSERTKRSEEYKKKAEDAERRAQLAEAVKNGALEEAERIASQKVQDKLSRLQEGLIKREVKGTLASLPDFNTEAVEDAMKLFLLENQASYNDDDSIKIGDKALKDVATEWIKTKPLFIKTKTLPGTGLDNKKTVVKGRGPIDMASALENLLNKG